MKRTIYILSATSLVGLSVLGWTSSHAADYDPQQIEPIFAQETVRSESRHIPGDQFGNRPEKTIPGDQFNNGAETTIPGDQFLRQRIDDLPQNFHGRDADSQEVRRLIPGDQF